MKKHTRPRRLLHRPRIEGLESRKLLAVNVFPVTNTGDSGPGSLRAAITASNAMTTGTNEITFNIATGSAPFTISTASTLPNVTVPVTIDGTTQTGYGGSPVIVLNGAGAGSGTNGFTINSTAVTIKALAVGNFSGVGIEIIGAGGDSVTGSYIGVNAAGTAAAPNSVDGILIFNSPNNTIGGPGSATNVISGNTGSGVDVTGASSKGDVVSYDILGLNAAGNAALPNNVGISEELGSGNVFGKDLVSGNTAGGISLESGSGNVLQGNLVGTNNTGASAIANGAFGINVQGETNDRIGISGFANISAVSGNIGSGIIINGSTGTSVANTFVGLNKAGSAAVPNTQDGVLIENASRGTTIGGTTPDVGNFISGNTGNGVDVESISTGTFVGQTHIGSDLSGLIGVPNGQYGIQFHQTSGQVISNTIVDNAQSGVLLYGSSGSLLQRNYIGDVVSGAHGNAVNGVFVFGSNNNTIGGAGAGNVISSNASYGVSIESGSQNNLVAGNLVGLGAGGVLRPNANGIAVFDSTGTTIGGLVAAASNLISGNTGYGIDIDGTASTGSQILGNLIGLPPSGVTAAVPNASGVILNDAVGVLIQQNIISGNTVDGVYILGGSNSVLHLNLIGTDVTGYGALGNGGDGVDIDGAQGITVGGTSASTTNVIAGNKGNGIEIANKMGTGAANNSISADWIGVNLSGTAPLGNGMAGVYVNNVPGTTVGGVSQAYNFIANSGTYGVYITGASAGGTQVVANFIGLGADGETVGANALDGVIVQGTPGVNVSYDVISGNTDYGVHIASGATGVVLHGDAIGTDAYGLKAKGNGLAGVLIDSSSGNTIGGTAGSPTRNIISGNAHDGIFMIGTSSGNAVQGNYIGVNVVGNAGLGNNVDGLLIQSPGNTIGGTAAGAANVISNNGSSGVHLLGGANESIQGNLIGTDSTGANAIGNGFYGVFVDGTGTGLATHDTVGGTSSAARNVITGNGIANIAVAGANATGTLIQGNAIGTNSAGTLGIFNTPYGIILNNSASNTVGGTTAGAGNTISGSVSAGLQIINAGASTNLVQGNLIGRASGGNSSLANALGVIINNAPNNTVGGAASGASNTITGNTTNTIQITGSGATGNQTSGNVIGP